MFDGRWRTTVERGTLPVGSALRRSGLRADHFTGLGLALAAACAVAVGSGRLGLGLGLLIGAAVPDMLDGAVAKASGTSSTRGAFFDSVADRVTDLLVLGGIAWYLGGRGDGRGAMLAYAVAAASTVVSYERAKAESLGLQAKGGLMERAERTITLMVALAFSALMVPLLWVMLALTSLTAVQRFVKVWRQAGRPPKPTPTTRPRPWRAGPTRTERTSAAALRWQARRERLVAARAARRRNASTRP